MDEITVDEPRDDGAQRSEETGGFPETAEVQLSQNSFYRSQREVDEAFKKRFAAEREKWETRAETGGEAEEQSLGTEPRSDEGDVPDQSVREQSAEVYAKAQALIGRIRAQAEQFPEIRLGEEMTKHPMIAYLLAAGHELREVYEFIYPGMAEERRTNELKDRVMGNIRARNMRPAPISSGSAQGGNSLPYLSEKRMEEIAGELHKGRKVSL